MNQNQGPTLLKAARLHAGLSQEQLGEKIGLTRTHVSRVESGQRETPLSKVEKWFEACGYTMNAAPVGERVAPRSDAGSVQTDALFAFLGILRAWPRMTERERRVVSGQLSIYAEEFGTDQTDVSPTDLRNLVGVMQAWPEMPDRVQRVLLGQFVTYAEEYGTKVGTGSSASE